MSPEQAKEEIKTTEENILQVKILYKKYASQADVLSEELSKLEYKRAALLHTIE